MQEARPETENTSQNPSKIITPLCDIAENRFLYSMPLLWHYENLTSQPPTVSKFSIVRRPSIDKPRPTKGRGHRGDPGKEKMLKLSG